jgi:anaerobic selenocysteine-containing dehydrogenase
MTGTTLRTTCPRDCYDSCGLSVVVEDGRVAKVMGDKDHPVSRGGLCGKCAIAYNGVWIDEDARVTQPLRRAGAKGEGAFEAISWDDALAEIAAARPHRRRGCGADLLRPLHRHLFDHRQ